MTKEITPIDLAKAYGKHDYHILDADYRTKIFNHPLVQGLYTVGNYFVLVGNMKTMKTEYIGGDIEYITGYNNSEAIKRDAEFLINFAIPEDNNLNIKAVQSAIKYLQGRPLQERELIFVVYFYRARKKNGEIIAIQHQSIPILLDANSIPYIFTNIFTVITHLGMSNLPMSTLINRSNGDVFHITPDAQNLTPSQELFSEREKEVLQLLVKGETSKAIAEDLDISYETARTHRKNILNKAGLRNTTQLVGYALTHGIL